MTPEQLREEYQLEEMMFGSSKTDEIDYEDCALCNEAFDITEMKHISKSWVCVPCQIETLNEDVEYLVIQSEKRRKERIEMVNLKVKQIDVVSLQLAIKQNCKPEFKTH